VASVLRWWLVRDSVCMHLREMHVSRMGEAVGWGQVFALLVMKLEEEGSL